MPTLPTSNFASFIRSCDAIVPSFWRLCAREIFSFLPWVRRPTVLEWALRDFIDKKMPFLSDQYSSVGALESELELVLKGQSPKVNRSPADEVLALNVMKYLPKAADGNSQESMMESDIHGNRPSSTDMTGGQETEIKSTFEETVPNSLEVTLKKIIQSDDSIKEKLSKINLEFQKHKVESMAPDRQKELIALITPFLNEELKNIKENIGEMIELISEKMPKGSQQTTTYFQRLKTAWNKLLKENFCNSPAT